jgi:hypothetical protein
MKRTRNIIAIDVGNSSGRFALCEWDGQQGRLREIYQFPNAPVTIGPHVVWDTERIWGEILRGLQIASSATHGRVESMGLDSWGAEYVLIDREGSHVGHAYSLRDPRNVSVMERAFQIVPVKRIYDITGIQVMPINTLYGLLAHIQELPEEWEKAWVWLGTPEYFLFRMAGVPVGEYTNAPNSQMVDACTKNWSKELCDAFGLNLERFPPIVPPGNDPRTAPDETRRQSGAKGHAGHRNRVPRHGVGACRDTLSARPPGPHQLGDLVAGGHGTAPTARLGAGIPAQHHERRRCGSDRPFPSQRHRVVVASGTAEGREFAGAARFCGGTWLRIAWALRWKARGSTSGMRSLSGPGQHGRSH